MEGNHSGPPRQAVKWYKATMGGEEQWGGGGLVAECIYQSVEGNHHDTNSTLPCHHTPYAPSHSHSGDGHNVHCIGDADEYFSRERTVPLRNKCVFWR